MADAEHILAHLRAAAEPSPDFDELEATLRGFNDFAPAMAALATSIDQSVFPADEWTQALGLFLETVEHTRVHTLQSAVGYLACCAQSQAQTPIRPTLPDLVLEMLGQFGFEGR